MSTLHRPRGSRAAHPISDYLERSGGIALVVAASGLAAGLATAMRFILPG